ncbi:hypothetical protein B0H11DRAFT_2257040 [Mycena galericulata]|nr:hypothetical protein B0H11DRAFT_2257040 [Mycena galericulata]
MRQIGPEVISQVIAAEADPQGKRKLKRKKQEEEAEGKKGITKKARSAGTPPQPAPLTWTWCWGKILPESSFPQPADRSRPSTDPLPPLIQLSAPSAAPIEPRAPSRWKQTPAIANCIHTRLRFTFYYAGYNRPSSTLSGAPFLDTSRLPTATIFSPLRATLASSSSPAPAPCPPVLSRASPTSTPNRDPWASSGSPVVSRLGSAGIPIRLDPPISPLASPFSTRTAPPAVHPDPHSHSSPLQSPILAPAALVRASDAPPAAGPIQTYGRTSAKPGNAGLHSTTLAQRHAIPGSLTQENQTLKRAGHNLLAEGNAVGAESDAMARERDALEWRYQALSEAYLTQNKVLQKVKDNLASERDTVAKERDAMAQERDLLTQEEWHHHRGYQMLSAAHLDLMTQNGALKTANDELAAERDALQRDKDAIDGALKEKSVLQTANEELAAERDALRRESITFRAQIGSLEGDLVGQREALNAMRRDKAAAEGAFEAQIKSRDDELVRQLGAIYAERNALTHQWNTLKREKAHLVLDADDLQQTIQSLGAENDLPRQEHQTRSQHHLHPRPLPPSNTPYFPLPPRRSRKGSTEYGAAESVSEDSPWHPNQSVKNGRST